MRETRRLVDSAAMPWESLSDVLQRKLLNGDPETGPHTLLLRSGPRDPGPDFAQYHPIDEELMGLDGDFTFDGSTWFRSGSYAFYPAYFVHGSRVHVRGGYCVYLRQSGPSELFTVDHPTSHVPYYVGKAEPENQALQLADAEAEQETIASLCGGKVQLKPLHRDPQGRGSSLLSATPGAEGAIVEVASEGMLEVFVLSGAFELTEGGRLQSHGYHCEVAAKPTLLLLCSAPGTLMISHDGVLQLHHAT